MDSVRTDILNLIVVFLEWLRSWEDRLEFVMDIGEDLLLAQVFLFIVRYTEQTGGIDLGDQTEMFRVNDELASLEAVLSERISDIACHQPLGKRKTLVS